MKKYFSKEELSSYREQMTSINKGDKSFQALLNLYSSLYAEILSWGTHTANVSVGFLIILFTGTFYGITYSKPLFLIILPPLFGLLCILLNMVFIWVVAIAFKMAEIEVCFQKAGILIFNWITKHSMLSQSKNSNYLLAIMIMGIYFLIFFTGLIYSTIYVDYLMKIGSESKMLVELKLINVVFICDYIDLFLYIVTMLFLLNIYRKTKIKIKQLGDYLSDVDVI